MSIYTGLVSTLAFPLQERLKGHDTVRLRRQMEESQYWPLERLEWMRLQRLRALLAHAAQHVPYYRDLFGQLRFDPGTVRGTDDLRRLPLLDKATIRSNLQRLRSERAQRLSRCTTGGSSGEPLIFFIGPERVAHDVAAKWRATRWWGVDIGDPEVVLWGSPIELAAQDRLRRLRDTLMRSTLLPAFEMSPERVYEFIHRIRARRPRMLFGYPSAIAHVAQHAQRCGIRLDRLGIRVAFVTSERLYEHQREIIERVFGCPVANGYGGRDAGFIGHDCPAGGMHLTYEDIVVETLDEAGQPVASGEAGEIVVTHLATRDFPLIRYRTGDIGVLSNSACSCGRTLPLMADVQGRSTDFLVARNGTVMHGLALIYVLRDLPGIRQFQIEQESRDLVRIRLATEPDFDTALLPRIIAAAKARLGDEVEVVIERVASIRAERSGKYRHVLSRVDQRQAGRAL